jgi:hypothetical protein
MIRPRRPLGRGFERYYGFLGGETSQWYPDLIYDNHPVTPPKSPQEGYHLTTDLTDKAIEFIQDAKAIAPDKPFFLYFCPGAAHAPHHIFRQWADRYRGQFDMGYEAIRETILARQKAMGILPAATELSPINPYAGETGPDGQEWPDLDTVRPWDSLSSDEKRLFARMAEVYAGFLSHADHEIGRLTDYLDKTGQLDDTIVVVVSDNGASGEGGPNGSVNENKFFNGMADSIEENLALGAVQHGVVRDRIGQLEDRFFATVFLGSGLLFVAMLFAGAAFAGGLAADAAAGRAAASGPDTLAIGRQITSLLLRLYAMRMAAVFTMSAATITLRTRVVPRRIGISGIAVAAVLLVSVGLPLWIELLFPSMDPAAQRGDPADGIAAACRCSRDGHRRGVMVDA